MPACKEFVEWFTRTFPHSCIDSDHARSCLAGWNAKEEKFTSTNSAMDAILALKKNGISGSDMHDVGWNGAINTVVDVLKQHQ